MKTINEANSEKLGIYQLLLKATVKIKIAIFYEIKNKLKQYAKYMSSYRVRIKYIKSKFFWIFNGHIH